MKSWLIFTAISFLITSLGLCYNLHMIVKNQKVLSERIEMLRKRVDLVCP